MGSCLGVPFRELVSEAVSLKYRNTNNMSFFFWSLPIFLWFTSLCALKKKKNSLKLLSAVRVCMLNVCKEAGFGKRKYKFLNLGADSSLLFLICTQTLHVHLHIDQCAAFGLSHLSHEIDMWNVSLCSMICYYIVISHIIYGDALQQTDDQSRMYPTSPPDTRDRLQLLFDTVWMDLWWSIFISAIIADKPRFSRPNLNV